MAGMGTAAAFEDNEEIGSIGSPARRPHRQTSSSSCYSSASAGCCNGDQAGFLRSMSTAASVMLPASSFSSINNKDPLETGPHPVRNLSTL